MSNVVPATQGADAYVTCASPIGPVYVAYNEIGVSCCEPVAASESFETEFRARFGRPAVRAESPTRALGRNLERALESGRLGDLRLDLRSVTDFQASVLHATAGIPVGEVRSYAWVADEIGHPRAVRAVGSALAANPVPILVPCHRVVRTGGGVGNFRYGSETKRRLLRLEGVALPEDDAGEAAPVSASPPRVVGVRG
ncbi:MAG: MGMT family protein [Acidimicrobiia bacterium]|nr:MGMT family protein [Acidimicrobiia bacterium]